MSLYKVTCIRKEIYFMHDQFPFLLQKKKITGLCRKPDFSTNCGVKLWIKFDAPGALPAAVASPIGIGTVLEDSLKKPCLLTIPFGGGAGRG
jgi:hypothetical protein